MIMVIARTVLHIVGREAQQPLEVTTRFSNEMYHRMERGQFMTLNFLLWHDSTRSLQYASAGHEHVLWYHAHSQTCERIRAGGIAVGLVVDSGSYLSQAELKTSPGDVLLLYTDGVTEARNVSREMFTLQRLETSFTRQAASGDPETIQQGILDDLQDFIGTAEQYDDITLLVLCVEGR